MKRLLGFAFACTVVALSLLGGCAAGGAIAGGVADRVEGPAIAALEAGVSSSFGKSIDKLEAGELDKAGAIGVLQSAQLAMARLTLARLAYDATIGGDAPPSVQRLVAAARAATDEAFGDLAAKIAERLALTT